MSMVASAHFVRFVVALAYPAFEAVTAQPTVLGSRPEMLYRPSPSVVVRWPPTKISAPSRGVGRVGVTADMTPERVKVGWVAATSAVGVVGLLLPQAHIETASPKTTDKRFMGSKLYTHSARCESYSRKPLGVFGATGYFVAPFAFRRPAQYFFIRNETARF